MLLNTSTDGEGFAEYRQMFDELFDSTTATSIGQWIPGFESSATHYQRRTPLG
jgi:hypothetical protein